MSEIKPFACLSGTLTGNESLSCTLSCPTTVKDTIPKYTGDYEITPKGSETQELQTADKMMTANIVVKPIPYKEESNSYNGLTVYIGGENN